MANNALNSRVWRERMLVAGRCVACGAEKDCWQRECPRCRESRKRRADPVKRRAIQNARSARIRAERRAMGLPVYPRGPGKGLGCSGESLTPEQRSERGRKGGMATGKIRAARVMAEAVNVARRAILDVRSDFTREQLADMSRVLVTVYRVGLDQGYIKGRKARFIGAEKAA